MEAPQNLEATTPEPIQPFAQFESEVRAVAISPQGLTRIAVGLGDGTIEIWDVLTRTMWISCQGHASYVTSVAFSPDGSKVVSGSGDFTVRLWDVQTGKAIGQPFTGHTQGVISVAFSPDGSKVVSGSGDSTIRLWDVQTGKAIGQPFTGHTQGVISVAFSPDGNMVVSGSLDNKIRLWDVQTGKAIGQPFTGHTEGVISVAFNQDGTQVVSGSDDTTVRLWNVQTGKAIGQPFTGHTQGVISVAFSPDGTQVVSGSDDTTVRLWDIQTGKAIGQPFTGHIQSVYSVAWSLDGKTMVSGSCDGTVRLWKFNIVRISQAFSNDQATGEDSLDVTKELESLADVLMLRSLEPPLAVAILGGWGSGKSFGMHLIEKQITKIRCQQLTAKQTWGEQGDEADLSPYVGHVYQIKFNAWSYAKSDLWASLMQTIFDQLDRQLTLEQQLGKVSDLLSGGDIWRVINQMSDSDRKAILESELGKDVFANLEDGNALWDILSEVREKEQKKLKESEAELASLEIEMRNKNEKIETQVNQKFENKSRIIFFLSQFKELSKDDFGDSVLKDFLNTYGFKNREDLEDQFPIFKHLDKLQESDLIEKIEDLIKTKHGKIENIIKKSEKIKSFVEKQPSPIVGLIEFIKKDQKTLFIIVIFVIFLPFICYFLIVDILPGIVKIISVFSTVPAIVFGIEIFKKSRIFQAKISRLFRAAKESLEQEKQKLAAKKDQEIKDRISENQKQIETKKAQIERQKQRIGLTAQYKSLLDFVNNRLEDNSYQKLLGLMNQIQSDLADLSDRLTYKPGNTNPEKLEVLKRHFPRGQARIVLYIDDLDRCPPDKVVQVLEAVQLLLNTDIFIIVLAIDDRYIGRALEQTYRGILKRGGTPSGVDYLEKIIQLPYRMRPISKDVTENYLKSLVDIEEKSSQDESIEISVNNEEKIEENYPPARNSAIQSISEPRIKELNSEENNRKIQHSANTDPLVSFERFTAEEFGWISECCQHVDLTPRTAKRLINICKIIKTIWTPLPNDKTWKQEPKKEYKETLIAFLALAGRYPKEMRKVLEEIYLEFEETDENTVIINKDKWLNRLQNLDVFMDRHNQREWKKFKNDFRKMPPETGFVFEKRTFNLAVSFCFVGDIGYDPDDNYNREYRFEDRQKQYGFQNP